MNPSRPTRRVLFASTGFETGGGIASVDRCIHDALEEQVALGRIEAIDLLSLYDERDVDISCSGVFRTASGSRLRFAALALKLLAWRRPDLLIIDHLGLGRVFHLPIVSRLRKRTVLFVHGTEFWAIQEEARLAVVRDADLVLTNSEFTAGTVLDRLPEVRERICPVPLCIEPRLVERWTKVAPADEPARESAVLIVARMHQGEPGKGHDVLIDAWPRVRRSIAQARLWIVGDGTARKGLEERARSRGGEGVEFLGRLTDRELSDRYRRAALFAMPSRQEGFGLVYAEAMWHGLPCIGSDADAAQEVIRNGSTGAIVPYGDVDAVATRIIELLSDPGLRSKMGEAARREALTRFSYPRFRDDLLRALDLSTAS